MISKRLQQHTCTERSRVGSTTRAYIAGTIRLPPSARPPSHAPYPAALYAKRCFVCPFFRVPPPPLSSDNAPTRPRPNNRETVNPGHQIRRKCIHRTGSSAVPAGYRLHTPPSWRCSTVRMRLCVWVGEAGREGGREGGREARRERGREARGRGQCGAASHAHTDGSLVKVCPKEATLDGSAPQGRGVAHQPHTA
jgi:hypothetical protein